MDVKIVENFLDPIDFQKVEEATNVKTWEIQRSDPWNKTQLDFLFLNKTDDDFFNTYLYKKVKEHLDGKYELTRVYYNGQWSGRDGSFHADNCDVTALLYVSPYEYGWGGFTEIMTSAEEPTLIHPLQNRLVFFPGKIMHKGYAFCYQSCPMRLSLAFKLNTK